MKILIVKNEPAEVDTLRQMLSRLQCGVSSDTCSRVNDAVHLLSVQPFDGIFLDLNLPDAVGFDGLRTLHTRFPKVPIAIVAGDMGEELRLQARSAGAVEYLNERKFGWRELVEAVYLLKEEARRIRRADSVFASLEANIAALRTI